MSSASLVGAPAFGTLLRQLRKRAGMTQGDLAAAVGYSVPFISDLEQARRLPTVAVIVQQFIPAFTLDLLDDGPSDAAGAHRTLRNAIHRRYALCTAEEQRLFRTLGIFVSSFDLAAVLHFGFAEAALQALIHKNLVKVEAHKSAIARFLLLETRGIMRRRRDWLKRVWQSVRASTTSATSLKNRCNWVAFFVNNTSIQKPGFSMNKAFDCFRRSKTQAEWQQSARAWAILP